MTMSNAKRILLYGATGFMGQLLAERAAELKLPVVLAGRNASKLADMSERLGLAYVAFALETPVARSERLKRRNTRAGRAAAQQEPASPNQAVDKALANVGVVLNAAGPFAETAVPLARACLRTETHYVDISGEYETFGALRTLYDEAGQPDVAVVPGAGLTVLGSDLLLREALEKGKNHDMGAPHVVRVALSRVPSISRGSAKTMLESVRGGVRAYQNGKAIAVPVGTLVRSFDFGSDDELSQVDARICTAMTLADARSVNSTVNDVLPNVQVSTLVPNIETYVEASSLEQLTYELGGEMALALRTFPLKGSVDYALSFWPEGPPTSERNASRQQVVVEVEDRYRRTIKARLSAPNSYDFTVAAALAAATALQGSLHRGLLGPSKVVEKSRLDAYLKPNAYDTKITLHGFAAKRATTASAT
jgi:short subunit dehydrogenase-like uncharacterized protein